MFDGQAGGRFVNTTKSGIITSTTVKDQANVDRWAQVLAVGPDVTLAQPGEWVLVESGYWTEGFEHEGGRAWKTDEEHLILVSEEPHGLYD
jgi:co-chaperonin GroES (HSP10)